MLCITLDDPSSPRLPTSNSNVTEGRAGFLNYLVNFYLLMLNEFNFCANIKAKFIALV